MPANRVELFWIDEDEDRATHVCYVDSAVVTADSAVIDGLLAVLDPLTNAGLTKVGLLVEAQYTATPAENAYDAEDKIIVQLRDALGNIAQIVIPAPLRTLMIVTDEALDGAALGALDDLVTEALIVIVSRGRQALTGYVKNWRTRFQRRRR